jgi:hypothetical protein
MPDIFEGKSNPFDPVSTRLADMERLLSMLHLYEITGDMTALGARKLDVLARVNGKGVLPSGIPGPFSAYMADNTPGEEKIGLTEGHLITDIVTGAEMAITGMSNLIPITANMTVWIDIPIAADLTATGATISNGPWPDSNIDFATDTQTMARAVIGTVYEGALPANKAGFGFQLVRGNQTKDFYFEQSAQTNLFMALMTVNGKAAIYPLAFTA